MKNQNEVVHMKKNCALHFLIASLVAILLNLNNLLTGGIVHFRYCNDGHSCFSRCCLS